MTLEEIDALLKCKPYVKQDLVTTDNSQTLVNALVEIERLNDRLLMVEAILAGNGALITGLKAEVARLEPLQYRQAPCHKFCESQAYEIEIRGLKAEIDHLRHCISNQENVVLAQKAEIERLTAQCEGWRQGQKEDLALQVELHKENQRLKAKLADAEATVELSGAECERRIQEVDASREAIDRKDAALRVALDALEYHTIQTRPIHSTDVAIATLREAL